MFSIVHVINELEAPLQYYVHINLIIFPSPIIIDRTSSSMPNESKHCKK